jgi:hypothetical protein
MRRRAVLLPLPDQFFQFSGGNRRDKRHRLPADLGTSYNY